MKLGTILAILGHVEQNYIHQHSAFPLLVAHQKDQLTTYLSLGFSPPDLGVTLPSL